MPDTSNVFLIEIIMRDILPLQIFCKFLGAQNNINNCFYNPY